MNLFWSALTPCGALYSIECAGGTVLRGIGAEPVDSVGADRGWCWTLGASPLTLLRQGKVVSYQGYMCMHERLLCIEIAPLYGMRWEKDQQSHDCQHFSWVLNARFPLLMIRSPDLTVHPNPLHRCMVLAWVLWMMYNVVQAKLPKRKMDELNNSAQLYGMLSGLLWLKQ